MKTYGGVTVKFHLFFPSALDGGEWSVSLFCHFIPGEIASGTHWIGGWEIIGVSLDTVAKRKKNSSPCRESKPCLVRSLVTILT